MKRVLNVLNVLKVLKVLAVPAMMLAGCGGSAAQDTVRVFDFGVDAPAATFGGVRASGVRAGAPFDAPDMLYRLAYRDGAELLAFAQSRWAASPGVLLQRRFLRATGTAAARCAFDLELAELSQVFSSPNASEIHLEGRATMSSGAARVGERIFRIREANAGGTAASGAHAAARAADRLIAEISQWSVQLPACAPS